LSVLEAYRKVNATSITWQGISVFLVKDGRIKEWSDYTIPTDRQ
jgi:hypothetical protein